MSDNTVLEKVPVDVVPSRVVAIIDDAFIAPKMADRTKDHQNAMTALFNDPSFVEDLKAEGIDHTGEIDAVLDALTAPDQTLGVAWSRINDICQPLGELIEERLAIRQMAGFIAEQTGTAPICCNPENDLPDLTGCDLVLIDYYLDRTSRTGDKAQGLARGVWAQHSGKADQQIVLMSSKDSVRGHRGTFRSAAALPGAAFTFIHKPDMDELWKVKAHLGMLQEVRPYAPSFADYQGRLGASLEQAAKALLALADDLDISDYAYLQSRALMNDGHPLGDYISWLLSAQFTTLAFEGENMRQGQAGLDKLEFERNIIAPIEPSTVVANLFHSALLSSNVGALGPHPRAKAGGPHEAFPLVQLGDVFMDVERSRAVVILSADCDLAFSPNDQRPPKPDTPVLMVPGTPVLSETKEDEKKTYTAGIVHENQLYRIDWDFSGHHAVALNGLQTWLVDHSFKTENRDRLRTLYALKLQQEFASYLFRVGPPIMPPMTFAADEAALHICIEGAVQESLKLQHGEVMLSRHKDAVELRTTPRLISQIKAQVSVLLRQLEDNLGCRPEEKAPKPGKPDSDKLRIAAIENNLQDDDFWIALLDGVSLPSEKTLYGDGSSCSFVRGEDWKIPTKPKIVLAIREKVVKAAPQKEERPVQGSDER